MFELPLRKLHHLNYFLGALMLVSALLFIRDLIGVTLSKKNLTPVTADRQYGRKMPVRKNLMHYSPVLEKNPFGPPMTLTPVTASQDGEAPSGNLSSLVLMGTAVGPKNLSYAILEDRSESQGKQDVFTYGENVFGYGILKKIGGSSVEIEQNSVTHTVSIPDVISSGTSQEKPDSQQASFAKKVGEREYILDSRKVRQSLENPEQILTDARLLPNIKDGRQEGFTISEVVKDGIYHSLGLRNGDVLLKVNGLEMSNPEVAIQAMSALRGMNNVSLDIIRGGQSMSMNYRMR
ncbi:MAG: hypothetical protein C4560_03585 [Nitrospiraceae bacterium]|nr:MAG: hypothetical protein C4560_03585 [Nitrospiraceae bacterium]